MRLSLASLQWVFFILTNSIVAPLSISYAFHLSPAETAELIQRTFFITGLASLLQVLWGHRLPIMEGAAGLWWGVFLTFASLASTLQQDPHGILQNLQLGFLVSGALFVLLGLFKLLHLIKRIFTPIVSGTYLILLVAQMSGTFTKGIFGINGTQTMVDWKVALPALIVLVVSIGLAYSRFGMLRTYSVLFGIGFGWLLFMCLGLGKSLTLESDSWFAWPALLAWGELRFDAGILLTSIVTGLLLLTNLMTSIEVVGKVVQTPDTGKVYNRSSFVMGVNQILGGLFSTVGFVPVSYTAGFIVTTKITQRLPFIIGNFIILCVSFFPVITHTLSLIPVPVGYAVSFLSFSNLIGLGLKEYASGQGNENQPFIIGISLMVGLGCMFISPEALRSVPAFLVSVLNNGLVMGVLTCIGLEQGIKLKNKRIMRGNTATVAMKE